MHRPAALLGVLMLFAAIAIAANAPGTAPYDPSLDGWKQLQAAGKTAAVENKRVLVIVGGNWCKWCRALDGLMSENSALRAELGKYQVMHLN
jgi:thioredoxin-related protein